MKKGFILYAAAIMAAMSSCSNDSDSVSQGENENGRYPIMMAVANGNTSIQVDKTRGTGMVGDVEGANNKWNGEELRLIMLNHNELIPANEEGKTLDPVNANIESATMFNRLVAAPTGSDSALVVSNTVYYYPAKGDYDFFGYHIDDAATTIENEAPAISQNENQLLVNFKIDGTQDLMVAKANIENEITEEDLNGRFYSAFAARRGVQPTLQFKHLLTQINFNVLAAENVSDTNPITIDSIAITANKTEGNLTVAYTGNEEPAELISWTGGEEALFLMDKSNNDATTLDIIASQTVTKELTSIGKGILLAPETSYNGIIYMSQVPEGQSETKKMPIPFSISLDEQQLTGGFKAGYAYNVNIMLYGIQKIDVTTTLSAWQTEGDPIPVVPEDEI